MDLSEAKIYSAASFITSFLIMEKISPYICSSHKSYRSLDEDVKIGWNSRVLSFVHSFVVTILAVYTVRTWDFNNRVEGGHQFSYNTAAITAGYIAADFVMMDIYQKKIDASLHLYLHHVCVFSACVVSVIKQKLLYYICFKLIAEASTVFLNLRFFLLALNMKSSFLYKLNGFVLVVVFFLCRLAVMPVFYYQLFNTVNNFMHRSGVPTFLYALFCMSVAVDSLNVYWFKKIFRAALSYRRQSCHNS